MARKALTGLVLVVGVALLATGCGSTNDVSNNPPAGSSSGSGTYFGTRICDRADNSRPGYAAPFPDLPGGASTLSGAGSTFIAPMMSYWTKAYSTSSGVQVAYQSIGSGGGVAQILAGTVDFGASDTGMSVADQAKAKGPILQLPLLLGAVVPAYHLSGVSSGLKFTGDVLGKIYAGKIRMWDDPALTALNPQVKLPKEPIAVVHRSDGSGTTNIWTDYLTKASPTWVSTLGGPSGSTGKTVAWPTGIGGKGNEGVSGQVNQTEGALGYLELQYALAQNSTYGQVQNKAGNFIQPCVATVTRAVNGVTFPPDLNTSLTDGTDPEAYPISGTTYALIHQNQTDAAKGAALVNFLGWVLSKGQDFTADLNYAPLGTGLQQLAVNQLKQVTVNGRPAIR
ncbi:phosphate ABC transporter substrate-binding protein PstS [Kitasatospora sp. GP82]|uniref:phosphate ABC transporter substrate-binding protein PstS n=1 Tax=Kitasatospora sp. GP82 TaxID=3035089 RepID=UPI0024764C48|nr:phosphate ABC transporter substrate-binding protein PstS [Kitasatospora sp. GP82]MDH6128064.1 phosphate transport system substrate-binding protein [Kitasatospora sp. GP82]